MKEKKGKPATKRKTKKQNKRLSTKFLLLALVISSLFAGYQLWLWQKNKPAKTTLKIGFITDAHFNAEQNKKTKKWKLDWRSREAMERFVQKMNDEFKPDLVVENGDLIDGKDKRALQTWQEADQIMKKLKAPYFHVLGNHETNSFTKQKWLQLTGYDKTYYFKDFSKNGVGYRIIVLDGNSRPDDSDATPERHYYPGHIDQKQWRWLEKTLQEANEQNKNILVFIHQPPLSTDFFPNWGVFPQGDALHKLFNKHKVRAVFSGHIENLCHVVDGPTHYFVLQGFWKGKGYLKEQYRFKDAGAFYYITVDKDKVSVVMERRVFNDKVKKGNHLDKLKGWFKLPVTEEYNCQDGQQLLDPLPPEFGGPPLDLPVNLLPSDLPELSGLTFWNGFTYLVGDDGALYQIKDKQIIRQKQFLVPDAEGLTHDKKYLYVLSELQNTIYQLDKDFNIIRKQKIQTPLPRDVNLGAEGLAYYKDNLFFVVYQKEISQANVFLVNFSTGKIVGKRKIPHSDLAGATFHKGILYLVSGREGKVIGVNPLGWQERVIAELNDHNIEGIDILADKIYLVKDNEEDLKKKQRK